MEKLPPFSREAEEAVIGAMVVSPASIPVCLDRLEPGDFYFQKNSDIFIEAAKLWNGDATSVDQITLSNKLPDYQTYIHYLAEHVVTVSNIAHYAEIVAHKAYCRKLIDAGHKITEMGYNDGEDITTLIDSAEAVVYGIRPSDDKDTKLAKDIAHIILHECETGAKPKVVSTGFKQLDEVCGGLHASNLIIVGARPGVGKTAVALSVAQRVAREGTVLFVSLEMSQKELMERLICSLAGVHVTKLRNRDLSSCDVTNVMQNMKAIEEMDLRIVDNPHLTTMGLKSKARQYASKTDLKLIVIDYLQLMSLGLKVGSRLEEVTAISKELKILARELHVPVLALCQLNRQSTYKDKDGKQEEPDISHLRESGSLEQDADQVWLLSWPKDPGFGTYDAISIKVAKNRHGQSGTIVLPWNKRTQEIMQ